MGHPWHSSRWYWYSSYSRPASIMNGSATGLGWTADESRSALAHLNQWCRVDGRRWFHAGNQSSVSILHPDRWCSVYPVGDACVPSLFCAHPCSSFDQIWFRGCSINSIQTTVSMFRGTYCDGPVENLRYAWLQGLGKEVIRWYQSLRSDQNGSFLVYLFAIVGGCLCPEIRTTAGVFQSLLNCSFI